MCLGYTRACPDVHEPALAESLVAHVAAVIGLQRCFRMYAIGSRTTSLSILIAALCGACGSESRDELSPDAGGAVDAADAAEANPLDAFSAPSNDHFHLVASGRVGDGRSRVYYAPRVMYLDVRGTSPELSALIFTNTSSGERRYALGGSFSWSAPVDAEPIARLQREADAARVAVIRADLGLPHLVCAASGALLPLTFATRCDDEPRVISFGLIGWQASQPRDVAFDTAKAAIDAHLADGSAWDDVLSGDLAWHIPGGEVLHTKLEIGCVGQLFDANGDPSVKLFESAACRARHTSL